MANTILSPTVILKEAGMLFHQKAKFISSLKPHYDNRFAQAGAKVGSSIALRDRNEFTVGSGSTMIVQDVVETSQTLTVGTQSHVGLNFGAAELSLSIDEFRERYLVPAMARLATAVEADVIKGAYKATANLIDGDTAALAFSHIAKAKQRLDECLAPDDERYLMLSPAHATAYLDATKGLYTPGAKLGQQYNSGMVQDALGFNSYSSTLLGNHTTGTAAKTSGYSVDNAGTTSGSSITLKTGSTTFLKGDVITIATLNAVHPETKDDLGYLKQFVVTEDSGANATTLKISPAIVYSGAKKNVSASSLGADRAVVKIGAGANETLIQSLAYHPEAVAFATADLENPSKYGAWGDVQNMDGISMRIWRAGDILNDKFPCRIDVFYGYLARYPQLMCRIHADG